MQFMATYSMRPEQRDAAIARFLKTGAAAPKGVKIVGRWHSAGLHDGFVLCEADDAEAAARLSHEWADLLTIDVVPVLDDTQLGRVLSGSG